MVDVFGPGKPKVTDALTLGLGTIVTDGYGEKNATGFAALLEGAAAAGITRVDTASAYGSGESERLLGLHMKQRKLSFDVCTKIGLVGGQPDAGRDSLWRQAEAALSRLQLAQVDTLLLHRPDPGVPVERSLETLRSISEAGLARKIGFSNVDHATALNLMQCGLADVIQAPWSLLDKREQRLLEAAAELGIERMVFGVLAFGILAGSVRHDTVFDSADWRGIAREGRDPGTNGAKLFLGDAFTNSVSHAVNLETLAKADGLSLPSAAIAATVRLAPAEQIIVGCRTRAELDGLMAAADIEASTAVMRAAESMAVV